MARTLQQLKESVEKLIEQQGKDAPCAAFIFTQDDVVEFDDETLKEQRFPADVVENVLNAVDEEDYIVEQVFDFIEDELRALKHNVTV